MLVTCQIAEVECSGGTVMKAYASVTDADGIFGIDCFDELIWSDYKRKIQLVVLIDGRFIQGDEIMHVLIGSKLSISRVI